MAEDIFFSVMICCYNSEKYLRETIDSVINQTHTNWEIVAVNDGSIDRTEEIILDYIEQGIPITYHKQENKGFADARNMALKLAKSDWIAIIDHDDICLLDRLKIQSANIRENPNAMLLFANTVHFNNEGVEIRHQFDRFNPCKLDLGALKVMNYLITHGCFIDSESVVFNKKAALSIGGFNNEYKYVADADFFKQMGSKFDFFASDETISKWRMHEKQASKKMESIIHKERKLMFRKYFLFNGVTNLTRLVMIIHHFKYFIKIVFGKNISLKISKYLYR